MKHKKDVTVNFMAKDYLAQRTTYEIVSYLTQFKKKKRTKQTLGDLYCISVNIKNLYYVPVNVINKPLGAYQYVITNTIDSKQAKLLLL